MRDFSQGVQALFSYIMEARIEESRGADAVLAVHFPVLSAFDKVVEEIMELLSEDVNEA